MRALLRVIFGTATLAASVTVAQMHKVAKPDQVVRAVGVYEWTGDFAKPTASRLIPVSLYIEGKIEDAGIYIARPIPFALLPGNLYILQSAGVDKGTLDLAYAISIWSHFAPGLGLSWFQEMHRLIRPGGHLVCTTHGLTSVAHDAAGGRSQEQSEEILDALYRQGSWYASEFGEEGDWGVVNPDWGTAFLSPEWLLTQLCPRWRVLEFAPGRNQDNQDVYVLQRV